MPACLCGIRGDTLSCTHCSQARECEALGAAVAAAMDGGLDVDLDAPTHPSADGGGGAQDDYRQHGALIAISPQGKKEGFALALALTSLSC